MAVSVARRSRAVAEQRSQYAHAIARALGGQRGHRRHRLHVHLVIREGAHKLLVRGAERQPGADWSKSGRAFTHAVSWVDAKAPTHAPGDEGHRAARADLAASPSHPPVVDHAAVRRAGMGE